MDPEAEFSQLYQAHRAAVHAYLLGRTGDRASAADLMQEVFLRAWKRLPELALRTAGGQRAWIFTVARNLTIDSLRQQRTRDGTAVALATTADRSAGTGNPGGAAEVSTTVIAAERVAVLDAALDRLPETQRTVLAMATAGGLTSAEIAEALGVPAGTVRYRLSLARRSLAAALADYDDPPIHEEQQ